MPICRILLLLAAAVPGSAFVPAVRGALPARRAALSSMRAAATMAADGMKKVLVLGGDGFCGWPTALHLSNAGHDVTVLDNLSRRKASHAHARPA